MAQKPKKTKSNQSKRYDWFKQNNQTNKNAFDPRATIKKTWKTIRILLYIILLAISLTGCIQSFIVKTDSLTGRGLELYNQATKIAPHMSTVQNSVSNQQYPIYVAKPKDNYWLTNNKTIKIVHAQIETEGGDIAKWKTRNEALRVLNEDGTAYQNTATAKTTRGYLVASLSQSKFVQKSLSTNLNIKLYDKNPATLKNKDKAKLIDHRFSPEVFTNFKSAVEKERVADLDTAFRADALLYLAATFQGTPPATVTAASRPEIIKAATEYNIAIHQLMSLTGVGVDSKKTTQPLMIAINKKSSLTFFVGAPLRAVVTWGDAWALGPFYGMFVWPLSKLVLGLEGSFPMLNGWESIIIIAIAVIIIRTIAYALTFKSTLQQVKQQEMNAKKATIENKYAPYKGNKQMDRRKQQEISDLYKKEGISPLGAIGGVFLTMPLFLAMWRIIGGIPHFKSTTWLGINFASTSYKELFAGQFQYLPLMALAALVQGFSQLVPRLLTRRRDKNRINVHQKAAMKKANRTQNIILVVFVVMALIFSAGIQIYWIVGGLYTILQNYLNHKIIQKQSRNRKKRRVQV